MKTSSKDMAQWLRLSQDHRYAIGQICAASASASGRVKYFSAYMVGMILDSLLGVWGISCLK
jgi:hypothetical protein